MGVVFKERNIFLECCFSFFLSSQDGDEIQGLAFTDCFKNDMNHQE